MARTMSTLSCACNWRCGHCWRGTTLRLTASASACPVSASASISCASVCCGGTRYGAPLSSISISLSMAVSCSISLMPASQFVIQLGAIADELDGLHLHALLQRGAIRHAIRGSEVAHFLRDLHRAEMRPAHRAEVRHLGRILGQGLVVEFARLVRI